MNSYKYVPIPTAERKKVATLGNYSLVIPVHDDDGFFFVYLL